MLKSLIVLIVLTGALTGCVLPGQKTSEKAGKEFLKKVVNKTTGGRIKVEDNGEMSFKTSEGEVQFGTQEVVSNFPEDVPIYQNAGIRSFWQASSDGEMTAIFETQDELSKVECFYRDELIKAGWQETGFISEEDSIIFTADKEQRSLWVTLGRDGEITEIAILVGSQE